MKVFYEIGAIAWLSTLLGTDKAGPFNLVSTLREKLSSTLGPASPFHCPFCTGPWVYFFIVFPLGRLFPNAVKVLGILGWAAAVRGQSQEF